MSTKTLLFTSLAAVVVAAALAAAPPRTATYERNHAREKYKRPDAIPFPKDNAFSPSGSCSAARCSSIHACRGRNSSHAPCFVCEARRKRARSAL